MSGRFNVLLNISNGFNLTSYTRGNSIYQNSNQTNSTIYNNTLLDYSNVLLSNNSMQNLPLNALPNLTPANSNPPLASLYDFPGLTGASLAGDGSLSVLPNNFPNMPYANASSAVTVTSNDNQTETANFISQKEYLETINVVLQGEIDSLNSQINDLNELYDSFIFLANADYDLHPELRNLICIDGLGYRFATPEEYELYLQSLVNTDILVYQNTDPDKLPYDLIMEEYDKIHEQVEREYTPYFNEAFKSVTGMEYSDYLAEAERLRNDLATTKAGKYYTFQQLKEEYYTPILFSEEFLAWVDNGGYETAKYKNKCDKLSEFEFLTESDRNLYCYLYETQGKKAANQFIEDIEDRLNRAAGNQEAADFIASITNENGKIDDNALAAFLTTTKGLGDGIQNFGEGIMNVFSSEGMISQNQYAQMAILDYLKDHPVLTANYELSTSLGNMLPSMAIAAVITLACPPAGVSVFGYTVTASAAASFVSYGLTGLSAAGNAKNQALIDGNSYAAACFYGTLSGLSEAALGEILGNIGFMNAGAKFALSGLIKEGFEEFSQEYVDAGLRAMILGDTIDLSELTGDALKSFMYGVIMSGITTGAQTGGQKLQILVNNTAYSLTMEQLLDINQRILSGEIDVSNEINLSDYLVDETNTINTDINIETDTSTYVANDVETDTSTYVANDVETVVDYFDDVNNNTYTGAPESSGANMYVMNDPNVVTSFFKKLSEVYVLEKTIKKYTLEYKDAGEFKEIAIADAVLDDTLANNPRMFRIAMSKMFNLLNPTFDNPESATNMLTSMARDAFVKRGKSIIEYDRYQGFKYIVNNGISPSTSQAMIADFKETFNKVPYTLKSLVDSSFAVEFFDSCNPYDLYWQQQYNIPFFVSGATGGQGTISFYNGVTGNLQTIMHELAHNYDTMCAKSWGVEGRISESSLWLDAMKKDQDLNGLNGVSDYARSSNSSVEDFAESIANYELNPLKFRKKYPNRAALIERYYGFAQSIKDGRVILPSNKNFMANMTKNATALEMEILSTIDESLDDITKIRKLYLELSKRFSYSAEVFVDENAGDRFLAQDTLTFETLQSDQLVCKGWSELFYELLIDAGFDPYRVQIKRTTQHFWIEIRMEDGVIICDGTEALTFNETKIHDLISAKSGFGTVGMAFVGSEFSGQRLKNLYNTGRLKPTDVMDFWRKADIKLGYSTKKGLYANETAARLKSMFGSSKTVNPDNYLNQLSQLHFDEEMNGLDAWKYVETMGTAMFGADEMISRLWLQMSDFVSGGKAQTYFKAVDRVTGGILFYTKEEGVRYFINPEQASKYSNYLGNFDSYGSFDEYLESTVTHYSVKENPGDYFEQAGDLDATLDSTLESTLKMGDTLILDQNATVPNSNSLISLSVLEEILTDESMVQKFMDFENNQDVFGDFSKEKYLTQLEQYVQAYYNSVTDGTLDLSIMNNYNRIITNMQNNGGE